MNNFSKAIYSELSNPGKGVRLPTYPDQQYTGLLAQQVTGTLTVDNVVNLAVVRDPSFPVWADVYPSVAVDKYFAYGATWAGPVSSQNVYATTSVSTEDLELYRMSPGPAGATNQSLGFSSNAIAPACAAAPLAVFPTIDSHPWLWVPANCQLAVGIGTGTTWTPSTGNVFPEVVFQRLVTLDQKLTEIKLTLPTITPGTFTNVALAATDPTYPQGTWLRPARSVLTFDTGVAFTDPWRPYISLMVFNGTGMTTVTTTSAIMPLITPNGTKQIAYLPLFNLETARSQATLANTIISAGAKMVGASIEVSNVTAVSAQEGVVRCLAFKSGGKFSPTALPTDSEYGTFMPRDKHVAPMANSVYTAVRPGGEFGHYVNTVYETGPISVQTNLVNAPVINIYPGMNVHMFRFTDFAAPATNLLLDFRYVIEFQTTDSLLQPRLFDGTIDDLQLAVHKFMRDPAFRQTRTGSAMLVDRRPLPQPNRALLTPKPKPRAPMIGPQTKAQHVRA